MKKSKRIRKNVCCSCIICNETDKAVLDVHRIVYGCDGGTYDYNNTCTLCSNCHRKVHHTNEIKIEGWFTSTMGSVLHCWVNGEEKYLQH